MNYRESTDWTERTVTWHGQRTDGVFENDSYKLFVPSREHDFVMADKED